MVNIWSHLLGFLLFGLIAIHDNLVVIPELHGSATDHLFVTIALICFQVSEHLYLFHKQFAIIIERLPFIIN